MSEKFTAAEIFTPQAYEMILRLVDRDGWEPLLSEWIADEEVGWFRANILWRDDNPTGAYVRAQEKDGTLSYGSHEADGSMQSCFTKKRILSQPELDASLGMIVLQTYHGQILTTEQ